MSIGEGKKYGVFSLVEGKKAASDVNAIGMS